MEWGEFWGQVVLAIVSAALGGVVAWWKIDREQKHERDLLERKHRLELEKQANEAEKERLLLVKSHAQTTEGRAREHVLALESAAYVKLIEQASADMVGCLRMSASVVERAIDVLRGAHRAIESSERERVAFGGSKPYLQFSRTVQTFSERHSALTGSGTSLHPSLDERFRQVVQSSRLVLDIGLAIRERLEVDPTNHTGDSQMKTDVASAYESLVDKCGLFRTSAAEWKSSAWSRLEGDRSDGGRD